MYIVGMLSMGPVTVDVGGFVSKTVTVCRDDAPLDSVRFDVELDVPETEGVGSDIRCSYADSNERLMVLVSYSQCHGRVDSVKSSHDAWTFGIATMTRTSFFDHGPICLSPI